MNGKSTVVLGTCRLFSLPSNNQINACTNYSHSTKEHIQLIKFWKGEVQIPEPYSQICFRSGITGFGEKNSLWGNIEWKPEFLEAWNDSKTVAIEICSRKTFMHNGWYLNHMTIDRDIPELQNQQKFKDETTCGIQSESEIEADMNQLVEMCAPKKVVFVTHFNWIDPKTSSPIEARDELIEIVKKLSSKNGWCCVDPTESTLKEHDQETIWYDPWHLTGLGENVWGTYLQNIIDKQ